jgi:hypothetical protein
VLDEAGRAIARTPLRLLLAIPYLAFAVHMPSAAAGGLVLLASLGYGATLLLQEELLRSIPRSLTGHALGLHSCGLLAMQAVGATLAGLIAGRLSTGLTMTCLAITSIAVTLTVTPGESQEPEFANKGRGGVPDVQTRRRAAGSKHPGPPKARPLRVRTEPRPQHSAGRPSRHLRIAGGRSNGSTT